MINVSELRVNNSVLHKGKVTQVWAIYSGGAVNTINDNTVEDAAIDDKEIDPIPLTPEILEAISFVKMSEVKWNGNGADYQPETTGTKLLDYVLSNSFIFRFTDWFYTSSQNKVIHQLSMEVLLTDNYYSKINEGSIPCNDIKFLHQLQNLYFALTEKELEVKL